MKVKSSKGLNLSIFIRSLLLVTSLILLGVGLWGAVVFAPEGAEARGRVHWQGSMEGSLRDTRKQNKYVLADVYTDWCGWCKKLDQSTFKDGTMVSYLNSKFICVKVNAEGSQTNRAIAAKYKVTGFPTALVFNSRGQYIGRLSGYLDAGQYQSALEELIQHPNPKMAE